jgi:hypothetical protein
MTCAQSCLNGEWHGGVGLSRQLHPRCRVGYAVNVRMLLLAEEPHAQTVATEQLQKDYRRGMRYTMCVLARQSQSLVGVVAQISGMMCARVDLRLSTTRVEPESIRLQIQPKRGMPCG